MVNGIVSLISLSAFSLLVYKNARGIRWQERWEGGSGWGTCVNPWLFHFNVWQNPLQLKKKKTCHGHSGFLGWVIHQSCTQLLLLLHHHHYQSWAGWQLVAAGSSHAVFFHNMEHILNLSFHWEDKLIKLLCFHSLQYSLSLVLLEALIQLFC